MYLCGLTCIPKVNSRALDEVGATTLLLLSPLRPRDGNNVCRTPLNVATKDSMRGRGRRANIRVTGRAISTALVRSRHRRDAGRVGGLADVKEWGSTRSEIIP